MAGLTSLPGKRERKQLEYPLQFPPELPKILITQEKELLLSYLTKTVTAEKKPQKFQIGKTGKQNSPGNVISFLISWFKAILRIFST